MTANQIIASLNKIRDQHSEIEKCVDLIYEVQRTGGPLAEVITILKYEKPLVHSLLKARLRHNPGINLILGISMDYDQAKLKLATYS
ncbi:hypothetical protein [Paenibacillus koleovorans]|uniref:hypothetical protein n=1 Tax=Paenibacillus koleovorans TaxID=121608 RepID=UPI000FDBBACB|nr:hypothetical protein [Paenibacillus koleovorans]